MVLVCCLLYTGFVMMIRIRKMLIGLFFAFAVLGFFVFASQFLPALLKKELLPPTTKVDAIVVLGGGNGARVMHAATLYDRYSPQVVYFTGSSFLNSSEPQLMKAFAADYFPSNANFVLEEYSASTADHPKKLLPLFKKHDVTSILVVSSDFHTRRAYLTFSRYLNVHYPEAQLFVSGASSALYADDASLFWFEHEHLQVVAFEFQKLLYYYLFK